MFKICRTHVCRQHVREENILKAVITTVPKMFLKKITKPIKNPFARFKSHRLLADPIFCVGKNLNLGEITRNKKIQM